jgi:hypothetical protein
MTIAKDKWPKCPSCGLAIDPDNIEWSGGMTEAGTDFFRVEASCPCGWERDGGGWGSPYSDSERIEELNILIEEEI